MTARDATSRQLALVLPMIIRRKAGIALLETCDLGVSDYAAPILASHVRPDAPLAEAIRLALPDHDLLRIRPIRAEHTSDWLSLLGGRLRPVDFSAHAVRLEGNFVAWREKALSARFRRMLNRKKKRFFKQPGARVQLLTDPDEARKAISEIARLRAGRFAGDLIQAASAEGFYAEAAALGATNGLARTYTIKADGQTVGHAFGITHAGRFNYLLIGCDYAAYGRHSPGLLLYDSMIEDWIANSGSIYDFTIGDEPFKKDFGTEPTAMYELLSRPTLNGHLAVTGLDIHGKLRRLWER